MLNNKLLAASAPALVDSGPGQKVFAGISADSNNTQTTYTWSVPGGITSISAVAIGSGYSGDVNDTSAEGGRAGDLRWINNVSVTPGEVLTIYAANGGYGDSQSGAYTRIARSDTSVILEAAGGETRTTAIGTSTTIGGDVGGGNGGNGGSWTSIYAGGGGGTGGYSGYGGTGYDGSGSSDNPQADSGAAWGGDRGTIRAQRGGGVNLIGIGATGSGVSFPDQGGSYGTSGKNADTTAASGGGMYGAGGGGHDTPTAVSTTSGAAPGAARIIYGDSRSFPSDAGDYLPQTGDSYSEIEIRMQFPRNDIVAQEYFYVQGFCQIRVYDENGTNFMPSLTAVTGPVTSFSSLSAGQFSCTSSLSGTQLSKFNNGVLDSTDSTNINAAAGAAISDEIVVSFFIKPSTAKQISKIDFVSGGTGGVFTPPEIFIPYIRVVGDGQEITNGDAVPVPTWNYLSDSVGISLSLWTVEFT